MANGKGAKEPHCQLRVEGGPPAKACEPPEETPPTKGSLTRPYAPRSPCRGPTRASPSWEAMGRAWGLSLRSGRVSGSPSPRRKCLPRLPLRVDETRDIVASSGCGSETAASLGGRCAVRIGSSTVHSRVRTARCQSSAHVLDWLAVLPSASC